MRRISLALALLGAVAATGCGSSASSQSGGAKGVSEGTFTVNVQNGQSIGGLPANPSLAIKGGYVTSTPAGIDCGVGTHTTCSAAFPADATVTLTATATVAGNIFWGWAGDCAGTAACELTGKADKYILAQFDTAAGGQHSNYTDPAVHSAAYRTHELDCRACHGAALQGLGIAVGCTTCHQPSLNAQGQAVEQCGGCHAGEGKSIHQDVYNTYTDATALTATIDSVTSTANGDGTFKVDVLFTLRKSGTALTAADYTALGQKRLSLTRYTDSFETATAKTLTAAAFVANGQFRSSTASVKFDPKAVTENGFFYFYFADKSVVPPGGHYFLPNNTVSVSQLFGTIGWTSSANVSACESCHGKEYAKHGYRQAKVAGLPDFVACKACHTDQRRGVDFNLAMTAEDPARLAYLETLPLVGGEVPWSAADEETYAYTATTMQDTHISHAKEFLYPQSMANCATCHAGKLTRILSDANFTGSTCKSCHLFVAVNGNDPKRAPLLAPAYHDIDWVKGVLLESDGQVPPTITEMQCNECHADNADVTAFGGTNTPDDGIGPLMFGNIVPLLNELHSGYDKIIYADSGGTKYSSAVTSQVDSVSRAGNVLTINFSVSGAAANAIVKPTVVISLYGYDTKDFIVGGHASQPAPDGKRNLEWAEGASSNSPRLTVSPGTAAAGTTSWTATADLTLWAAKLADGSVKKAEIGILPALGLDQAVAPQNDATKAGYNPYIAIGGVTKTFDLVNDVVMADAAVYGKAIVDTAKCNKCHDALATTFHSPSYGGAGVVACRLCHVVGSGGSHLEMQSRSIDSYVHAIHSFQAFDISSVNFADTVGAFEYGHHIGATYPNFTTLNCESCHFAGTYEAPDPARSLPGILSASSAVTGKTRAINGVPSVVTGPGSRACGGCHRAELVKQDDASGLAAYDKHTGGDFGYREAAVAPATTTTVLNDIIAKLFGP